ncbi:fatty acid desaturase [Roseovarius sp. SCSIO 43702]|uniref:fatty acid desaturase n=1 Tax=Roseovarius sp. SCSIO 43702 TaxID=2823043 RepID=UPI001C730E52|nr:fatty acid desaturase [Roseovarius sp. SCSIO 43702]QYX56654.1 fatty acid desaturase [Roseovarius sp. SCSIO 43702]
MTDHKTLIASLPADTLARLGQRSDRAGLLHLAGHVGLIAGLALWVAQGWWLWPLALLPLGIAICFLFTLEHECTHKTPFRTPWLNEWVGHAAGLLILQPFEWFRYFHLAHHRHTNDPDRDPELLSGAKPETRGEFIRHVSGLPYWWAMARQTWRNALGRDPGDHVPARARPRLRREARVMLALHALAASSLAVTPLLFWIWLLPALLGQPFLRLYLLAEHGRCPRVANMLENTRTTYTNRIVRFLAWNMPYHTEHHTLPAIPFHQLPRLNALMRDRLRMTSAGYTRFTRAYLDDLRNRNG